MNGSVSVIIPNYNGTEHLRECMDSLLNQTYKDFDITVVDNSSTDDSVSFIKNNYHTVKIIRLDKNYGFARAVNEGIKDALQKEDTKFILLLNNDIVCCDNFIEYFLTAFINDNIYSAACRMLNYYNRGIIDDCGIMLNKFGHPYARGHGETDENQYLTGTGITGCCAGAGLYRCEVFEKIGLFDEDFIAYYEDVDMAIRIKLYGKECMFAGEAVCYHKRGGSYGKIKYYDTVMCSRNLVSLWAKYYPAGIPAGKLHLFFEGELRRYYHLLKNSEIKEALYSLKGLLSGLINIPLMISKRNKIVTGNPVYSELL